MLQVKGLNLKALRKTCLQMVLNTLNRSFYHSLNVNFWNIYIYVYYDRGKIVANLAC